MTKTSEVLIDRGGADRGFAAAERGRRQHALARDPACTTVPWHCCHVREGLQVSSLLANRGRAWGSVSMASVLSEMSVLRLLQLGGCQLGGVASCGVKATRDDGSPPAGLVKPAKKQPRACSAPDQVSQPHVTCPQRCGSRLRGSRPDVLVQPPIHPRPCARW